VGESGVDNSVIVREWHETGVDAVLVGGALMKAKDPAGRVKEFSLAE
jgi:indole-3-glycerol phosphate synthase